MILLALQVSFVKLQSVGDVSDPMEEFGAKVPNNHEPLGYLSNPASGVALLACLSWAWLVRTLRC